MSKSSKIILGLIVILLLIGAWFVLTKKVDAPTGPIKIGWVGPLSGDAMSFGTPMKNAVALAVEDINKAGGIKGRQIEMIYEDGKCDGKEAVTAVQKLINIDKVKIIIGPTCSGEVQASASIAEQNKVIMLSPAASSPDITKAGDYIFRNNPSDLDSGRVLAETMFKTSKKVAIISENTDYTQALRKVFMDNFSKAGGKVTFDENYLSTTKDFRSILTKVKATDADGIFVNTQTEQAGGTIVKQIREMGIKLPIFATIAMTGKTALSVAGDSAEGITTVELSTVGNDKDAAFVKEYEAKYGKMPFAFYLEACYDAVDIVAQAVGAVGEDATKIKGYLYDLKSFSGTNGVYGFDQNGDITGIGYVPKVFKDGKFVALEN